MGFAPNGEVFSRSFGWRHSNEFGIAIPIGLFAVRRQEVRSAGAQIATYVLGDDGYGVGLGAGCAEEFIARHLREGVFGQATVAFKFLPGSFKPIGHG